MNILMNMKETTNYGEFGMFLSGRPAEGRRV